MESRKRKVMDNSPMIRYTSAPTEYDEAIWGTLCTVFLNDDGSRKELYIQSSIDPTKPVWIKASDMLIKVYEKILENNKEFREGCLSQYAGTLRYHDHSVASSE